MTPKEPIFVVILNSAGTPDHGEFFDDDVLSPNVEKECGSLGECQRAAMDYRQAYELGGGNWTGGTVKKNGQEIGRISYNGRFWPSQGVMNDATSGLGS